MVNNFYLQKSQLVQEAAQVCDDFGAGYKFLPHVVIENQVQVALTESCFLDAKIKQWCECQDQDLERTSALGHPKFLQQQPQSSYLIFETKVEVGQHVQTWWQ